MEGRAGCSSRESNEWGLCSAKWGWRRVCLLCDKHTSYIPATAVCANATARWVGAYREVPFCTRGL